MKIFKRIFKYSVILILSLAAIVFVIFIVDDFQTSYLNTNEAQPGENYSYIIYNVNIIPMNADTVLTDHVIYIKDGIVDSVGREINTVGVKLINGKNGFLLPGLIDMHAHVWDVYELGLYLANGITTVRNVWGIPMHLRMKEKINGNEIYSPLFFTTGPKLTGPEFIGDDNLQLFTADEAKAKVESYKKRGFDFIKTYYGLTEDIFDAIIKQANKSGMEIVAHPSQKVPYSYHFNTQIVSIEHAEDIVQQPLNYKLDTIKLDGVVSEFAKAGNASFCPTLTAYFNIYKMLTADDILNSENVKYMNPAIRMIDSKRQYERWRAEKEKDSAIAKKILNQHKFHLLIIKRLHEAGVNIVCGTDAGIGITAPGFSIHDELQFYSDAGLSNYEVLKTATVNPSKTHSVLSNVGVIEKGKTANIILLEKNPLKDLNALKRIKMVVVKGKLLNENILHKFKTKAKNRNNFVATLFRYLEYLLVEK
jgi:imidazolonepropionase-like amidohydrolase